MSNTNTLEQDIQTFCQWISECNQIVFFGGAGVSTESGIPDFRSVDGLYHQKYDYPPETILSHTFFLQKTEEFYDFYRDKMICLDAKPNITHQKLAELEEAGKLSAVVTQNIDGLHQAAGSKTVYELHGSVHRNYCTKCHKSYDIQYIVESRGIPTCECGGIVKPDVVLYEEGLDDETMNNATKAIHNADMLIVGGTSLAVYPAAGLLHYFRGKHLVLVNKSATPMDNQADLLLQCGLGEVFSKIEC
ncbi:MAG: NAD-dependent protein deacylase [Lachnospiraceae bacterium]|nr:NAD-dependent protein deacylase [Lachnospiraceae bacterium]